MLWADGLEEVFQGFTVLRSRDFEERGLTRTRIRESVDASVLKRVGRGLYALPGAELTEHHSMVQATRREDSDDGGVRAKFRAMLGNIRIPIQIDIGFGDAITAGPELR
jgi:hypothetical protein